MPTGYTSDIYEGREVTFEKFALGCARAFGALVLMRDDAKDAPIPDEFPRERYHADKRDDALGGLLDLREMDDDACDRAAKAEYVKALRDYRRSQADRAALRGRYEAMLDKALAWEPPTEDHIGLNALMVEQLESSIQFDTAYEYPQPVKMTGKEWREARRKSLESDVEYHGREDNKEAERTAERNRWIKALRESLAAMTNDAEGDAQ